MKIYEPKPEELIRLTIRRKEEKSEYLTLFRTTLPDVKKFLETILEPHVKTFGSEYRTGIDIREATGAKNGKCTSISFFGLSPKETLKIIRENCEKP